MTKIFIKCKHKDANQTLFDQKINVGHNLPILVEKDTQVSHGLTIGAFVEVPEKEVDAYYKQFGVKNPYKEEIPVKVKEEEVTKGIDKEITLADKIESVIKEDNYKNLVKLAKELDLDVNGKSSKEEIVEALKQKI